MIYETKEIDFKHYDCKSYKIQINLSNPHQPLQRHIFIKINGEQAIDKIIGGDSDGWIQSGKRTEKELLDKGYRKVA